MQDGATPCHRHADERPEANTTTSMAMPYFRPSLNCFPQYHHACQVNQEGCSPWLDIGPPSHRSPHSDDTAHDLWTGVVPQGESDASHASLPIPCSFSLLIPTLQTIVDRPGRITCSRLGSALYPYQFSVSLNERECCLLFTLARLCTQVCK